MSKLTVESIRALITDEMARREGYKNAEMLRKQLRLGDIVLRWQSSQSEEDLEAYYELYRELLKEGWNPMRLEAKQALPSELMPKAAEGK